MGIKGIEEQPAPAEEGQSSDNVTDLIDTVDAAFSEHGAESTEHGEEPAENPAEDPDAEGEENDEETGEEEAEEASEEEDEESEEEDGKNVFSDEAYKIFKSRVGKEKAKREKVEKEVETLKTEMESLRKEADPNVQSVKATGIDSRFIDTKDAEVMAEAAKVESRINWLAEQSGNADGYEDPKTGKVWSQAEIAAALARQSADAKNQRLLAKAAGIREGAMTRQQEVIEAGLKALDDQAKAKAALKKKPKAKAAPAPATPESAAPSTHQPGKAAPGVLDTRALDKKGRTAEALAEEF